MKPWASGQPISESLLSLLPQPDLTTTWQLEQTALFHWATTLDWATTLYVQSSDKFQLRQNDHVHDWPITLTVVDIYHRGDNNYHRGGKSGEKEIQFKRIKSY
jgi:hypothetical protein